MKKLPRLIFCCFFIFFLLSSCIVKAQPVLNFQPVATGLNNPVDIVTAPGDDRLFIAQQNGLVRIWNGSNFIDFINLGNLITNPAGTEQGLLSIVFHPSYNTNRYFFVWYTDINGAVTLARYQRNLSNPDMADVSSAQVLLSIPKPGTPYFTNHNGGKLIFGADGMLYFGTGDGGAGGDPFNYAQSGNSLLGKMLRINVNSFATTPPLYTIPPDNPYAAPGDGVLDEIYALGLRNPWRWSFDRGTGDMWIADVGQNLWEEVNWRPSGSTAGVNYGWRCYEGAHVYAGGGCAPAGTVVPIFEYPHNSSIGGYSITGGYVYRGPDVQNTALLGYYITADYVSGNVWLIKPNGTGGWDTYLQTGLPGNISSFGESADGTLYALGRSTGTVYKIMTSALVPVTLTRFTVQAKDGYNQLEWTSGSEINTLTYHVEFSTNGSQFTRVGQVAASGNSSGSGYTFRHPGRQSETVYYRLAIEDADATVKLSEIVRLHAAAEAVRIYPTLLTGHSRLNLELRKPVKTLQLINSMGAMVWQKNMEGQTGNIAIFLNSLAPGLYILRVNGNDFVHKEKLFIQ